MAEKANETQKIAVPGLEPVPFVVVKLPDGKIVLRHPDELKKK